MQRLRHAVGASLPDGPISGDITAAQRPVFGTQPQRSGLFLERNRSAAACFWNATAARRPVFGTQPQHGGPFRAFSTVTYQKPVKLQSHRRGGVSPPAEVLHGINAGRRGRRLLRLRIALRRRRLFHVKHAIFRAFRPPAPAPTPLFHVKRAFSCKNRAEAGGETPPLRRFGRALSFLARIVSRETYIFTHSAIPRPHRLLCFT